MERKEIKILINFLKVHFHEPLKRLFERQKGSRDNFCC